jgi:hypothetical protein
MQGVLLRRPEISRQAGCGDYDFDPGKAPVRRRLHRNVRQNRFTLTTARQLWKASLYERLSGKMG